MREGWEEGSLSRRRRAENGEHCVCVGGGVEVDMLKYVAVFARYLNCALVFPSASCDLLHSGKFIMGETWVAKGFVLNLFIPLCMFTD